ncbi:COG1361 family protein [Methanothermococcus thermolithotrophicus]|uniref:hypothetical protein n=1 Tax=Methanothermococcus thermolithotrophicus TaxID=2186 RepID=UPI00036F21DD|nr:hypothetical protein [Methanothermococcus thermolithotrophicus]
MKKLFILLSLCCFLAVISISAVNATQIVDITAELQTIGASGQVEDCIDIEQYASSTGYSIINDTYVEYQENWELDNPVTIRIYKNKITATYIGADTIKLFRVLDCSNAANDYIVNDDNYLLSKKLIDKYNELKEGGNSTAIAYESPTLYSKTANSITFHYVAGAVNSGTEYIGTGSRLSPSDYYIVSFGGAAGRGYGDTVTFSIGNATIYQVNYTGYVNSYKYTISSGQSSVRAYDVSGGGQGYGYMIISYFDNNVELTSPFGFSQVIPIEEFTFDTKIITAPGVVIKEGTNTIGTTDINGELNVKMTAGNHELTFEFPGIILTKYVNIVEGINIVNVSYGTITLRTVDGLSGEALDTVVVSGNLSTTISGTYETYMPYGQYELSFTKDGYWEDTRTITVDGDKNITIELFPTSSIFFKLTQTPTEITTCPSSIADVTLSVNPIKDSYGTKLYITGTDVVKVEKNGVEIPRSTDGAYIIGDVSDLTNIKITFATTDAVGEHQFTVRLIASDILGNQYATQKTIYYTVQELPFIIQEPTWAIGNNTLTIIEQSGEDYSILLVLKDTNGTEIWSQSAAFNAYDSQSFTIDISVPGQYVLEISAKNGVITTYIPISVLQPIKLLTPEVEGSKGSVATVKLEIKNPTNEVKYYDATVTGSIFTNNTPKVTFSIAPGETKTVELKFEVPSDLEFDSYDLQVQVFEKDEAEPIFNDKVVLKIVESSFLPLGGGGDNTLLLIGAAGLILLLGVGAYYRVRT